jgi:hypothetical protein
MERQTRRGFLKRMGAAAGATFVLPGYTGWTQERKEGKSRPNIIIIVGDDMGYADIGCHGCKDISTPNIDSIAQNGVRVSASLPLLGVIIPPKSCLYYTKFRLFFNKNLMIS